MKTLLILRHAKSSWKHGDLDDHDRPLNKRGEDAAPLMGKLIKEKGLAPDYIISSTAVRARTTAELVAEVCGCSKDQIHLLNSFYHATSDQYLQPLHDLDDDLKRVMIVGHNPSLEGLVEQLSGEHHRLPTASLAQFNLDLNHWNELCADTPAQLTGLWRPKEIKDL